MPRLRVPCISCLDLDWYQITIIPWHSLALEFIKPCTHGIFMRKINVSALGAYLGLITLARTCMSHNAALQEKMLHRSVLSFGTHREFWN